MVCRAVAVRDRAGCHGGADLFVRGATRTHTHTHNEHLNLPLSRSQRFVHARTAQFEVELGPGQQLRWPLILQSENSASFAHVSNCVLFGLVLVGRVCVEFDWVLFGNSFERIPDEPAPRVRRKVTETAKVRG